MLRLILPLVISVSLFAQSISLSDLAFIVQKKDKVNLIFSSDVPKTMMVDFPSDYSKSTYMPFFRSTLEANNLFIREKDGIFLVTASDATNGQSNLTSTGFPSGILQPPPPLMPSNQSQSLQSPQTFQTSSLTPEMDYKISFVSHKLDFLQFDDVKPLLEFSGIPYSFSTVSKTITFKENKLNKKLIKKLILEIKTIDVKKDQVTLKITIFDTNLNKLREIGINPNLNFDFDVLTRAGALITGSTVNTFKGSLKFLQDTGATKVNQSTSYLISDAEQLDFKKVVSIPFLDENYVVSNTTGSTNQSKKYKYKDIGFKILATPTIVGDIVYLNFTLTVGGVITSGELPTTSENSITNKFSVKKGDIVLLAGISKSSIINNTSGSPFLESIPILRDIFTQKSDSNTDETFNVSIEILGDSNVETLFSRI